MKHVVPLKNISFTTALALAAALSSSASAQEVHMDIPSNSPWEIAFYAVAALGDVTGDGVPDLLVGKNSPALMRVVSGADGSTVYVVSGNDNSFGDSMASVGDVDGDGVPDFAIGEHSFSSGGLDFRGRIRVFSGASGQLLYDIVGPFAHARYGYRSVAGVGDIDGDGFPDIAFGGFQGQVHVHSGPNGAHLRSHAGAGTRPSVAGIGDVDGDGRPDYIVGWPQDSQGGLWAGKAVVYSGSTGAIIHQVFGSIPQNWPHTTGDHLGSAVTGVGDIDGDGVPDFACGAPGEIIANGGDTQQRVLVYSGADASVIYEFVGEEHNSWFGGTLAGGHDVNGDGVPDILVGAPNEKGPFLAVYSGSVSVYSGRTGTRLCRAFIRNNGATGWYVALLGDLDGDGLSEFASGCLNCAGSGCRGFIRIWSGFQADAVVTCDAAPNSVGPGAMLEVGGDIALGNDWHTVAELIASGAPPGKPGLFVYGPGSAPQPFGNGTLCVGSPAHRLGPLQVVESDGTLRRTLDRTAPPTGLGPGELLPGGTWTFQLWYRDQPGTFNLSEALEITFGP